MPLSTTASAPQQSKPQAKPASPKAQAKPASAKAPASGPPGQGLGYQAAKDHLAPGGGLEKERKPGAARPAEASQKDKARQHAVLGDANEVSNQDVIMEQLAHRGAYGSLDTANLAAWGYREAGASVDPESGFRAVLYLPTAEALAGSSERAKTIAAIHGGKPPPVLAFRGTAEKRGAQDDTSKGGVGSYQFASNEARVAELLAAAGGKVIVSGHSLGGALAQLTACHFPSAVSRVVTFQSPAIAKTETDKLKAHNSKAAPEEKVRSTHHRASGDLVHLAGEQLTEGDVFTYHSKGISNAMDHTVLPLARLSAARGDAIDGVNDGLGKKGGDRLTQVKKSSAEDEKTGMVAKLSEKARKFFGGAIRDNSMDAYVGVWKQVKSMITSKKVGKAQILGIIDISPALTPDQKTKMRDQAAKLMG